MRYFITVFLFIVFLSGVAAAADTQTGAYDMPALVVTAQEEKEGFDAAEKKTSSHRVVFDETDIANSPATTLSGFLQESGFAVIPGPTPFSDTSITIRGYDNGHHWNESSSRIIFLINGRRSGVNNIRQLALNNIQRIEIVRGPEMYMYSAGSPGGIVNIITKRGGDGILSGSLEAGAGSWDRYKGEAAVNGSASGFDYSLACMYETFGDYKDGNGDKVTNSQTDNINAFNGGIGYTVQENHRIGIEYYYYDVDSAQRPQYWDEEEGVLKDPSYVDRTTNLVAFTYNGESPDRRYNWNASYSMSRDEYISVSDPAKRHNQYWMGNKIETQQGKAGINYIGEMFDLATGADYIRYKTYNSGTPNPNSAGLSATPCIWDILPKMPAFSAWAP